MLETEKQWQRRLRREDWREFWEFFWESNRFAFWFIPTTGVIWAIGIRLWTGHW